jgi:exosortase
MMRSLLKNWLAPLLLVVVFVVLTLPTWQWLWGEWMGNQYYSHGLLIPFVSLFLIIMRVRRDDTFAWLPGTGLVAGLLLLAAGVGADIWFTNQRAFYLASFAMIAMVAGLTAILGGSTALRKLVFPIAYLVFMVPLPIVDRATLPLAMFTGTAAGAITQGLGLDVSIVGNAVTLPNVDLVIGAACSGINSLITLTALLSLVAYLVQGPLWARIFLVLLAFPLAVAGNILRVATLLFVARAWGADAAFTFYHDYSGLGFFVLVLLLLYPLVKLLRINDLRPNVI